MTGGRAVLLGPVGDNFAAGMSGGVAYVLDEEDVLARRVHAGALEIGPVAGAWAEELKGLLEAHARLTGSAKAALHTLALGGGAAGVQNGHPHRIQARDGRK